MPRVPYTQRKCPISWNWQPPSRRTKAEKKTVVIGVTVAMSIIFYRDLAVELCRRGWNVVVVSSEGPRLSQLAASGVGTHTIEMRRDPSLISDLIALCRWLMLLRRLKPTIVLGGTPKGAMLSMVAARLLRVRVRIYHLLGLRLETSSGAQRRILEVIERVTSAAATEVWAVSDSLRRVYRDQLQLNSHTPVELIANGSSGGVDTTYFARPLTVPDGLDVRGEVSSGRSAPVIGFVGRLTKDKGVDTLLSACRLLRARGRQFELLLIGEVEDAPYSYEDLGSWVQHVGHVDDLRPYYCAMDILCLPTLREGFPNVCLEAAAMSIPIVTTSATGAVDSIVPGRTGLLVPPADVLALTRALETLISSRTLRQDMGESGRNFVVSKFDRAVVLRAHIERIERLTES